MTAHRARGELLSFRRSISRLASVTCDLETPHRFPQSPNVHCVGDTLTDTAPRCRFEVKIGLNQDNPGSLPLPASAHNGR